MKLKDLVEGDRVTLPDSLSVFRYISHELYGKVLLQSDTNRSQLTLSEDSVCTLKSRKIKHLTVGDYFGIGGTACVVTHKYPEFIRYRHRDDPNLSGVLSHDVWIKVLQSVNSDPAKVSEFFKPDIVRSWQKKAMRDSINELARIEYGDIRKKFDELHKICEILKLDFWDIAFNMAGFMTCRMIISKILKSRSFAKDQMLRSDQIFRSDFI